MIIDKENIEECLLLLIDGELNTAEETEVLAFVEKHDEYKLLLDQFLETKLEIETLTFDGKESLLKEETTILPLRKKQPYMAWAAGIAAIIGIGIVFEMMDKGSIDTIITSKQLAALPGADTLNKNTVTIQAPDVVKEKHVEPVQASVIKQIKRHEVVEPIIERVKTDDLKPLAVADYKALNIETNNLAPIEMISSSPQSIIPESDGATNNAFVSADKLDLFNELADELASVKNNVKEKVKSIHISSFAISFGNKEYTIVK